MDILVSSRKPRGHPRKFRMSPFISHDRNPFAVRLDSQRLRQVAQSEIERLDKSKLRIEPHFR